MGYLSLVVSTVVSILLIARSKSTPFDVLLRGHPHAADSTRRVSCRTGVASANGRHFFLTIPDRTGLVTGRTQDWKAVIATRRAERERHATIEIPDTIRNWSAANQYTLAGAHSERDHILSGTPISIGTVTGPVRILRMATDWCKVLPGEILVVPVIDPGLAPSSAWQEG